MPKITSANLCKPIHDSINYFTFLCPSESGKCEKEGKKLRKFKYVENENSLLLTNKILSKRVLQGKSLNHQVMS